MTRASPRWTLRARRDGDVVHNRYAEMNAGRLIETYLSGMPISGAYPARPEPTPAANTTDVAKKTSGPAVKSIARGRIARCSACHALAIRKSTAAMTAGVHQKNAEAPNPKANNFRITFNDGIGPGFGGFHVGC